MYQLLLQDGSKMGQYNPNVGPSQTAKKMAKEIAEEQDLRQQKTFTFQFVKNRTKAEGGDKVYKFSATVTPLARTERNVVEINGKKFYKKWDIEVENLLRN